MAFTRRRFLQTSALSMAGMGVSQVGFGQEKKTPPNIVIIFLDDSGFADFQPFGDPQYVTPHVEQLAREGCRFNQFYVSQAICSASRASLMTGCYPGRTKVFGAHPPRAKGLDPKYATMGEILQKRGYKTACFGKWHLGDKPHTRSHARGFDETCGLMYSNDMWKHHPDNPEYWGKYPLQYWENGEVTVESIDKSHQKMLTTWYTEKAVDFIKKNKENPFFLYVPHSMPHVPIFCSDKFKGKSGAGLYGDVMMEIDWSVGQIEKALKNNGLDENTLVIFTSDNGPWTSYGNRAGETPYREAKATSFDGGTRSACIMKFPGTIKPGSVSDRCFCSIDILPTVVDLTGAEMPDNPVDGKNVWDLITNKPGAKNPHAYYPFSKGGNFEAIITGDGRWKLHLPHDYRHLVEPGMDGDSGKYTTKHIELSLFDMKNDPFETTNVIEKHPKIAEKLQAIAEEHKQTFYNGG